MEENLVLDADMENYVELPVQDQAPKKRGPKKKISDETDGKQLVNCLRNERVIVRFIKKQHPMVKDANHVASGGLVQGGKRNFSLPLLTSGHYKNCLTNSEKDFLEYILGLEENALSVYKKTDNFWDSGSGNAEIFLGKEDYYLNLSNPNEYILYKMLLANTDTICPSLRELRNNPKATYQYVLVNENDEARLADDEMSVTSKCYLAFGKYQDDVDTLRTIVEMVEHKNIDVNTRIEFLRQQINNEIKLNPKLFLSIIDDEYLDAKVVIARATKNGIISRRGDYYYMTEDNTALCEASEDPTLENAARFISNPKRQDLYMRLQAKLNVK